jgi:hypothetical protein
MRWKPHGKSRKSFTVTTLQLENIGLLWILFLTWLAILQLLAPDSDPTEDCLMNPIPGKRTLNSNYSTQAIGTRMKYHWAFVLSENASQWNRASGVRNGVRFRCYRVTSESAGIIHLRMASFFPEVSDYISSHPLLTRLVTIAALLRRYSPSPHPLLRLLSHVPALRSIKQS